MSCRSKTGGWQSQTQFETLLRWVDAEDGEPPTSARRRNETGDCEAGQVRIFATNKKKKHLGPQPHGSFC